MNRPETSDVVLFVGSDLNALARIEAACTAAGRSLRRVPVEGLAEALEAQRPLAVLIDLDEASSATEEVRRAGLLDPGSPAVLGYFSHVDVDTGRRATEAGITAVPRGRFWRELPETIASFGGKHQEH